jgi:hypothetical protein
LRSLIICIRVLDRLVLARMMRFPATAASTFACSSISRTWRCPGVIARSCASIEPIPSTACFSLHKCRRRFINQNFAAFVSGDGCSV